METRGDTLQVLCGVSLPTVLPLTILYTIFHRKDTPFAYISLKIGTPYTYFHKQPAPIVNKLPCNA